MMELCEKRRLHDEASKFSQHYIYKDMVLRGDWQIPFWFSESEQVWFLHIHQVNHSSLLQYQNLKSWALAR